MSDEPRRYVAKTWDSASNAFRFICLHAYDAKDAEHQASYHLIHTDYSDHGVRKVRPEHVHIEPYIEEKHGEWHGWQPRPGAAR